MPEILAHYHDDITAEDGTVWSARAIARPIEGHWEGWIEFLPRAAGHAPLRTRAETTQPTRGAVKYWASGLTVTYLEGALERARAQATPVKPRASRAIFETPASHGPRIRGDRPTTRPAPILDPFAVYAQGEHLLEDQLKALDREHLREIALAYELVTADAVPGLTRAELSELIVAAARVASRTGAVTAKPSR
jgi:hypothetical protein